MRHRKLFPLLLLLCGPVCTRQATAQRSLPLPSQVHTETLTVSVHIVDGVATTTMEQTLRNTGPRQAEATWILPLPPGAVADGFEMLMNGERVSGDVLSADQARDVYEGIVRRQQDPGLLEYVGRGCLRARIFPIPAQGVTKASVSFRHVLPRLAGLYTWSVAANAAGVGGRAPEKIRLDLTIESRRALKNAFSPHPGLHVLQSSDRLVRASFEGAAKDLPDGDLTVLYGLSEEDFGLDLLTHRSADEEEGTFLMLLSPKRDWGESSVTRKSITFVLDTSGSMAGLKMEQSVGALRIFLRSLHAEDLFNVVPFSTEPVPFFPEPVLATRENTEAALLRAEGVKAMGGTNLAGALSSAMDHSPKGENHVPLLVLLTDGQPTVGITDPEMILSTIVPSGNAAGTDTRIFVLGVGTDVNTQLLDSLAEQTRGRPDYISQEEDIEVRTGSLFAKLSHPVLTDLEITVDGVELTRTVPRELPDLFQGEELSFFGRFQGSGARSIRLTGRVRGSMHTFVYEGTFVKEGSSQFDFLPSLWAERRVGLLLDAIRLNGENRELVAEVERLGKKHHIVTPYTSHLIVEEGLRLAAGPSVDSDSQVRLEALGYGGAQANRDDRFQLKAGEHQLASASREPERRKALAGAVQQAGILPVNAPQAEVDALVGRLAQTLDSGRNDLASLAKDSSSGADAVKKSLYLRRLRENGVTDREALVGLFTKRVKDKLFVLRAGRWTDSAFDPDQHVVTIEVEAFTPAYFELLRGRPELAPYLALETNLLVVLRDAVIQVRPPGAARAPTRE